MEKILQEYFDGLLNEMKKSNNENDYSGFVKNDEVYVNQSNFLTFMFFRLYYEDDVELVRLYNKEFEIGITGEYFQQLYLICFLYIFNKRFNKSPIVGVDNKKVLMTGKAFLSKGQLIIRNTNLSIVK